MQPASQAFMDALSGSVEPVFSADVYYAGEMLHQGLPLGFGEVTLDSTRTVRGTCKLLVNDPDGLFVPKRRADPLAPYGQEINIRAGLMVGGAPETVSLGWYRIQQATPKESWRWIGRTVDEWVDTGQVLVRNLFPNPRMQPNEWALFNVTAKNASVVLTTEWKASGVGSMKIGPTSATGPASASAALGLTPGATYTITAKMRMTAPQTGELDPLARTISALGINGTVHSKPAPNVAGVHDVRLTVTAVGQTPQIVFNNGARSGGGDVWFADVVVVEGRDPGHYFDPTAPGGPDGFPHWEGATDWSPSTLTRAVLVSRPASVLVPVPSGASIPVEGRDRGSKIVDYPFLTPEQPQKKTVWAEIVRLAAGLVPVTDPGFDASIPTGSVVYSTDRWEAITTLAKLCSAHPVITMDGTLTLKLDEPGVPVWTVQAGADATMGNFEPTLTRTDIRNAVNVQGVDSAGNPITVILTQEDGPLRWGGPFGCVPADQIVDPMLRTLAQVTSRARQELTKALRGQTQALDIPTVLNYALELEDMINVNLPDRKGVVPVTGLVMPMRGAMTATVAIPDEWLIDG